jgi:hypothetical protein
MCAGLAASCGSGGSGGSSSGLGADAGPGAGAAASSGGAAGSTGGATTSSGGTTGSTGGTTASTGGATTASGGATGSTGGQGGAGGSNPLTSPPDGPPAGNPDGKCAIPTAAQAEDSSAPRTVVGTGTPASCTGSAFVDAVGKGGVIKFNCGPSPVTITLDRTAKVVNDTGPKIVIDGEGKVTLSGGGKVRILYQDTCDQAQKWTSAKCDNQATPELTVQNLTFIDGNSTGDKAEGGGGGAILVRGGRFKAVNCRFFNNVCDSTGPDLGGAAIRTLSQYQGLPVYIVNSTFGGKDGLGNVCSNGGGLSSIGVSYTVINSLFSYNKAIGSGANPAKTGTPGGGSGGAIYNDGNTFTLTLCGTKIENNHANEGGGAIFFVSNDLSGSLVIQDSFLSNNPSDGFQTQGFPGIFVLAKGAPQVTNSTIK